MRLLWALKLVSASAPAAGVHRNVGRRRDEGSETSLHAFGLDRRAVCPMVSNSLCGLAFTKVGLGGRWSPAAYKTVPLCSKQHACTGCAQRKDRCPLRLDEPEAELPHLLDIAPISKLCYVPHAAPPARCVPLLMPPATLSHHAPMHPATLSHHSMHVHPQGRHPGPETVSVPWL